MPAATLTPPRRKSPPTVSGAAVPPGPAGVAGEMILDTERGPLHVPADADTLSGFRRWTSSEDFPEWGRFDFVDGTLYLDLMSERLHAHSRPKTELVRVVANRVAAVQFGMVCTDRMRVVLPDPPAASCEPDLIAVSYEALRTGRVRQIPTADGDDTIEFEGPPDLVAELLSPSSETKDTARLPASFFANGVREYWLVDCRGDAAELVIHARGKTGFEPVAADGDGFRPSAVLGKAYRLVRGTDPLGEPKFALEER